jgi:hypothetical protein
VAVGDMVCRGRGRGWAGWIDIGCLTVCGHRLVKAPLVRKIKVSKWIRRTIQAIVVVAAIAGVALVTGVPVTWSTVAGAVWMRIELRVVYPVSCSCDSCPCDADSCVGNSCGAIAISSTYDASRRGAVCLLSSVGEDAALAVARRVDVLMARSWIRLHFAGGRGDEQSGWGLQRKRRLGCSNEIGAKETR